MIEFSALIAFTLLIGLTLFQLALIAGAPIGRFAWGGSHDILPINLRIGSVISILLYGFFSIIILSKAGFITLLNNSSIVTIGIWVLAVYFLIGIFMNGISRSKPERNLMTPIALVLAMTTLLIALN